MKPLQCGRLLLKHEGHLHGHSVLCDLAALDDYVLLLDPNRGNVVHRIRGTGDPLFDGILEADLAPCDDLDDFGYCHIRLQCD